MKNLIRLSKSCLSNLELDYISKVLSDEYLGIGSYVFDFEKLLSTYFGRRVTCVSSGTAALQLALQASGCRPGDEVLVQSLTYVASFQAITAAGAVPVACEINPSNLSISIDDAKSRLTPRTKYIMPVHYAGNPGDLDTVYSFASDFNLRVVEDAAHAFGSTYNNSLVGSNGDITCFSFDGIKNITCGEGGCIVFNSEAEHNLANDLRLLGVHRDSEQRLHGRRSWDFDVYQQGWRYHMSNLNAAIGIAQFQRFDHFSSKRKSLAQRYKLNLKSTSGLSLLDSDYVSHVPHIFPVILSPKSDRSSLIEFLTASGIQTGIHYKPNHLLSFFKSHYSLPVTEQLFPHLLTLPLHPDLSFDDIDFVCASLISALNEH